MPQGYFYKNSEIMPQVEVNLKEEEPTTNTKSFQNQRRKTQPNLESRATPMKKPDALGCLADKRKGQRGGGRLGRSSLPGTGGWFLLVGKT